MTKETFCEILGGLDEALVLEAREPAPKRRRAPWKLGLAAACLALVCAVSLPLLRQHTPAEIPQPESGGGQLSQPQPGGAAQEPEADPGDETAEPALTVSLAVNEVDAIGTADMDVQVQELPLPQDGQAPAGFEDFLGLQWQTLLEGIPENWTLTGLLIYEAPDGAGGYAAHDWVLTWRTPEGGQLRLALSPLEAPLRDWFLLCDDPVESRVGDTSFVLYGDEALYLMTGFSCGGLFFDLQAEGLTLAQLEALLTALIAQVSAG